MKPHMKTLNIRWYKSSQDDLAYFSPVDSTIFSFHIIGFNVNFFLYDSFFPFIVSSLRMDSYNVTLF
jgi:hypothetical protein